MCGFGNGRELRLGLELELSCRRGGENSWLLV